MIRTADDARALFDYDPVTGVLRWRVAPQAAIAIGDVAGTVNAKGYVVVGYKRKYYKAHRLAWLIVTGAWPKRRLDHEDGVKDANRFTNLREATPAQNAQNMKGGRSRSGLKGAFPTKAGRWQSAIRVNGAQVYLGVFATAQEAHDAYCMAARQHFGDFARAA